MVSTASLPSTDPEFWLLLDGLPQLPAHTQRSCTFVICKVRAALGVVLLNKGRSQCDVCSNTGCSSSEQMKGLNFRQQSYMFFFCSLWSL
jgi:hypothetical protein